MSNLLQTITNSVFPPSDPIVLCAALVGVYKSAGEHRAVFDNPSEVPGLELTRALQIVVHRNDIPCIILLFSQSRAEYVLQTEQPTTPRHKKGLRLLARLLELPPTVVPNLFAAVLDPVGNPPPTFEQREEEFVQSVLSALSAQAQHKKITRAVKPMATQTSTGKKI